MATSYLDKTGLAHFWNKIKAYLMRRNLVPEQTKTYTGVIGSTNNDAGTYLYCMKIVPESYTDSWEIVYRVTATIAGVSAENGEGRESSVVHLYGMRNTYSSYRSWNDISNTSYRPYYYHCLYQATQAGVDGGYGHLLGISLRYSYNPVTAANARTVTFEVLETKNCTVSFFDAPTKYVDVPGTGTTNYATLRTFDATTSGMTMTGDRNDPNYYNREYYASRITTAALYRLQLCLTKSDGSLVPINSVNNSVATNKTLTTDSFDPFGEIFYWASTSTYSANTTVGNSALYRQYLCDLRYSFNIGGYDTTSTLTARKPLYLVASPQSDGSAKLHSEPLSEALPTTDDGLIYIYLGRVYEDTRPYRCTLSLGHPVYWYKNGAIRQWTSDASTVTGHTVETDVPSDVNFNSLANLVSKLTDAGMIGSGSKTILLGHYQACGTLTNAAGDLYFSIPTGRVFPSGTTLTAISFKIGARAANQNGAGMYIIRNSESGTSNVTFNSANAFTFYNGAGASKTVAQSNIQKLFYGQTNIVIHIVSGTHGFSGNSTNTGYINNQPVSVWLTDISITVNLPS